MSFFPDKTSYSYTPSSPWGTYKIIAKYKNYDDVQSNAATAALKEPEPEPQVTCPADATYNALTKKCDCIDKTKTYDSATNTCS